MNILGGAKLMIAHVTQPRLCFTKGRFANDKGDGGTTFLEGYVD